MAVLVYWLNLLMLGATLFASWWYADRNGMVAEDVDAETRRTVYRIVKAQILWAVGGALCLIAPLLSIVFILLVQLIYAAAPRSSLLRKLIG
ncbi:hypothetical protein P9273_29065 [Mesorhizobium sp. WSM4935]|uniref:hypothetical protein n=1 Tax=Mesorhizobium sp. WSM4935 TaxID=3038547 RepID=UPI0024158AED|nr:hypothetical protein [Mesorhizobium sp. WSM4935]MDG4879133.1 hypothetical protein [Mesorhizobium sp. WSM4935]